MPLDLTRFPRVTLAHTPTPLEPLPNVGRSVGHSRLFIKRDDCTGLATGGNKARQLEFYFGEALASGADTVITTSAVQSNHSRSTAAAAAKLGMKCEIQLEQRVAGRGREYQESGNRLLMELFGAKLHHFPDGEDEPGADRAIEALADAARSRGQHPYVIHLGGEHRPLGALGYVIAAEELLGQCAAQGIEPRTVVTPSGSASTHCGLLVGLRSLGCDARVVGICVRRDAASQADRVLRRCQTLCELMGIDPVVRESDVETDDRWLGPSYGEPTDAMYEAMRLAARHEGLILDPVYSAKAFSGFVGLAREGELAGGDAIFLHTGGMPALFAYRSEVSERLVAAEGAC